MGDVLLFCTAEEAKPLIPEILAFDLEGIGRGLFGLVESRAGPPSGQDYKESLSTATFDTEFIGASHVDCQDWTLKKQSNDNRIEPDILGIADARTKTDGTIIMQRYARYKGKFDYGKYGPLPPKTGVWYSYRVHYKKACHVLTAFQFTAEENTFPVYYGLKSDLTSTDGVFDIDKAEELREGKTRDVYEFYTRGRD